MWPHPTSEDHDFDKLEYTLYEIKLHLYCLIDLGENF